MLTTNEELKLKEVSSSFIRDILEEVASQMSKSYEAEANAVMSSSEKRGLRRNELVNRKRVSVGSLSKNISDSDAHEQSNSSGRNTPESVRESKSNSNIKFIVTSTWTLDKLSESDDDEKKHHTIHTPQTSTETRRPSSKNSPRSKSNSPRQSKRPPSLPSIPSLSSLPYLPSSPPPTVTPASLPASETPIMNTQSTPNMVRKTNSKSSSSRPTSTSISTSTSTSTDQATNTSTTHRQPTRQYSIASPKGKLIKERMKAYESATKGFAIHQ